jgi:hypothetical protein
MRRIETDDDMKIVGEEVAPAADTAAVWQAHNDCGNLDRAHRLGKILAQQLLNMQEEDDALLLQKQMLFAFAMDTVGPALLTDDILVQTARGTFFARLRDLSPDFEDTMHRLGAFTFYRLSVDGYAPTALPAMKIGAVFAALCGKADDEAMEAEGADLFKSYVERLKETVSMVEFQKV